MVWNRTRKRDQWGVVRQRPRPESDWLRREAGHLRIVSDGQWQAVEERLEATRQRYLRLSNGTVLGRPPGAGAKYLLTGLMRCGCCGAGMEVISRRHGSRRAFFYACSAHHREGRAVCQNGLLAPLETLDKAVLQAVESLVLHRRILEQVLDGAVARLSEGGNETRLAEIQTRLNALQVELGRLADAVANGGATQPLMAAIREQEREALQAELGAAAKPTPKVDVEALRATLEEKLSDWRGLLRRRVEQGQQILRKLIDGRLVLTPVKTVRGTRYEFCGTANLLRILGSFVPHKMASPRGNSEAYKRRGTFKRAA